MKIDIFKGTLIYTFCNVFISGLAVITSPIFTRLMSVSDYGIYSLFNSWTNMIFCVTSLGLSYTIAPAYNKYRANFDDYTAFSIVFASIIPILLLFITMLGCDGWFSEILNLPIELIEYLWLGLFFYTIFDISCNKFTIIGASKKYAILSVSKALFTTLISICFILNFDKPSYYGRTLGAVIISTVICVPIIIDNVKLFPIHIDREKIKFSLYVGTPMIFHGLAMIALGQIDRIMISEFFSAEETGLYSYGYTIGTMVMFLLNASSMAIKPFLYSTYGKNNSDIARQMDNMVDFMFYACVLFLLMTPEVAKLLAAPQYWGTISFVHPIVAGCFCQYVYSYYCTFETILSKTKYIALGSIVASLLNLLLNYFLFGIYDFEIAAVTTFLGYFFLMIFHMLICRIVCRQKDIEYMRFVKYTISFLLISYVISYFTSYVLIRYVMLVVMLIVGYKKYTDKVNFILNKIKI